MFRWARAGRRYGARLRAAFFLLLLLGCCAAVDAHIRPVIQSMAAYQAKVYATRILNEAVEAQLAGESPSYRELVSLSTGDDGKINAVQTDVVRLNLLKAALTNAATDRLEELEQQTVLVPLGTLLGWQVLSGRGPLVEFRLVPAGYVRSSLSHRFDAAGINQTRHQIMLRLDASIIAVLPGYTTSTEVSTDFLLAETVIVGTSPDSFTQVLTGDDQSIDQLIADYGR
ncbi:sporulation protein YunB [Eubacteriales bacterium]|nr:sporulation protein YunB [Faecalicatena sp. BF-R-105]GKH50527.1 sporulation protein YunB [Eubacteriales bacterium]GKH63249.1 sporulation protein YunB [Eubacteriales bacterium]SFI95508.1 sporulation protein YunB [Ruminococcaceae bacterium D5]